MKEETAKTETLGNAGKERQALTDQAGVSLRFYTEQCAMSYAQAFSRILQMLQDGIVQDNADGTFVSCVSASKLSRYLQSHPLAGEPSNSAPEETDKPTEESDSDLGGSFLGKHIDLSFLDSHDDSDADAE